MTKLGRRARGGAVLFTFCLVISLIALTPVRELNAPPSPPEPLPPISMAATDQYGGLKDAPAAGASQTIGVNGYYHLEKKNGRWLMVSPAGNYMQPRSVYGMTVYASTYSINQKARYGSRFPEAWRHVELERMQSIGINVIGPYTSPDVANLYPIPLQWQTANTPAMPFLRVVRPSTYCVGSSDNTARSTLSVPEPTGLLQWGVKNLYEMMNPALYGENYETKRVLVDMFSPQWIHCVNQIYRFGHQEWADQHYPKPTERWMLATWMDEPDTTYGFVGTNYSHVGWIAAVLSPVLNCGAGGWGNDCRTMYSDPINYTKQAFVRAMQTKYGTIAALNVAWGAKYTQFDSTGVSYTDTICAGQWNGSKTTCSFTLAHAPDRFAAAVYINGQLAAGDDGGRIPGREKQWVGSTSGSWSANASLKTAGSRSGSIDYASGSGVVSLITPPASGAVVTVKYISGGWGKGTGLADEDGRHAWMGTWSRNDFPASADVDHSQAGSIPGITAALKADVDDFLGAMATQFYHSENAAVKAAYPNHLVSCPYTLPNTYPQLSTARAANCDIIELSLGGFRGNVEIQKATGMILDVAGIKRTYDLAHKPIWVWVTQVSTAAAVPGTSTPIGDGRVHQCRSDADVLQVYATQEDRGRCFQRLMDILWNLQASDGTYPVIGWNWWALTDSEGERSNFGLETPKGNFYDGVEDRTGSCTNAWGYSACGESGNYGNFTGYMAHENAAVDARIKAWATGTAGNPTGSAGNAQVRP